MPSRLYDFSLITACTARKRVPAHPRLNACDLPNGTQEAVLGAWMGQLESVTSATPVPGRLASRTYCGRGFAEALTAAGEKSALYVVSAGLGLIRSTDIIPSYALTVAGKGRDNIAAKVAGFNLTDWWTGLRDSPCSVGDVKQAFKDSGSVVIVAVPHTYYLMIERELNLLEHRNRERLRIVGVAPSKVAHSLQKYVMPFDERLDGPDSPIPGTKADFSQRAGRYLIEHVIAEAPMNSADEHARRVRELVRAWRRPQKRRRQKLSDDEVKSQIRNSWDAVEGRSSIMLRYFRDNLGVACEQTRFKNLFKEVAIEREATNEWIHTCPSITN